MPELDFNDLRLTQLVKKGGCAAKLPATELRKALSDLKLQRPKALAVGSQTLDDAALWDLDDQRYLVQTLDFFTPIVDDPEAFGAVAAANALSDVYAMGGQPQLALCILGFPAATLPVDLLKPLMKGALDRIHAAGACLGGGHSIDNDSLVLGFSVTGFVDKQRAWTNAGAKPGDRIILTKALGTGTITSALKNREAESDWVQAATDSMTQLNETADLLTGVRVHAATDITGFGLFGHAMQLAQASGVSLRIEASELPVLDGAWACLGKGILNRAHHTNRRYVEGCVDCSQATEIQQWLCVDPQTSGGLLFAIDPDHAQEALEALRTRFPHAAAIGEVCDSGQHAIQLVQ